MRKPRSLSDDATLGGWPAGGGRLAPPQKPRAASGGRALLRCSLPERFATLPYIRQTFVAIAVNFLGKVHEVPVQKCRLFSYPLRPLVFCFQNSTANFAPSSGGAMPSLAQSQRS